VNKFNLKFWGEILPGQDPVGVKQRFGKLFGIDNPDRVEKFFSGEDIILRRNLDLKTAAEYYAKLHKLGVEAELVKLTVDAPRPTSQRDTPMPPPAPSAKQRREQRKAEATARRQAEQEERKREAEERAARERAEHEERQRLAAEEAAQRKLQEEERKRREAEEAAKHRAEQEQHKRQLAEEAARQREEHEERQREEREEARRRAEEEAARKRAEEAERKRKAEEEAARKRAEEAERKRKEAEERARVRAEQQRLKEEQKAREKALREEAKRKAEAEAARKLAEEQEGKRKAEEQAAKKRAEEAERKRKAAQEAAKLRTEEEQRLREAAEEAARRKVLEDERKRIEAEAAARRLAEQEEKRREKEREAAAEAARIKAEREEKKRLQAEKAARLKAEERHRREQEQARALAEEKEQVAQRIAMEAQAITRGAQELGRQNSLKSGKSSVKTSLAVPLGHASGDLPRRRQTGEPNLYSLEPFRNTAEVKARAPRAQEKMSSAFRVAMVALALVLILGGRYLGSPPLVDVKGPQAMAVNPGSGPLLVVAKHLLSHDRSGSGLADLELEALGLSDLRAPLAFTERNRFLAVGLLEDDKSPGEGGTWPLLKCDLDANQCVHFLSTDNPPQIDALAAHPLSGEIFIADARAGQLHKFNAEGELVASAAMELPTAPTLWLESGLLYIDSPDGPGIGVFRYEDEAFAEQLDGILLLPPAAVNTGQSRVGKFVFGGKYWWAVLYNPEGGSGDLFRFDDSWAFVEEVLLPPGFEPAQLALWNDKILVADTGNGEIQRFSDEGMSEAPLASNLLRELADRTRERARLSELAWRGALTLCALVALAGLGTGFFLRMRSMVYRTSRERGAQPVDELIDEIRWIDPIETREATLKRRTNLYLVAATAVLVLVVIFAVHPTTLMGLIVGLSGPALALALLRRDTVGHIGIVDEQLMLVDHRSVYHIGSGSRVQYRGPFLLIDDVVVFGGTPALPAFALNQVQALVGPLRDAGVGVDRTTLAIKLLQGRHALALGALINLLTSTVALALVLLPRL